MGFFGGGLVGAWAVKSHGDEDTPECDGHVVVGRFGLGGVSAGAGSMFGGVLGCVSVLGVAEGDQAQAGQPEGHGTFDSTAEPVAGLSHSEDLACIGEGLLDAPPTGVAGHHILGCRGQVCGDQRQSVTAVIAVSGAGCVITDQDHADSAGVT